MAEIIQFEERRRDAALVGIPVIEKIVDGKIIECVDIDALPPSQRCHFISDKE